MTTILRLSHCIASRPAAARRLLTGLFIALTALPLAAATRQPPLPDAALKQAIDACNKDPAYRLGGAATGDCLEARSSTVDARIQQQLASLTASHCASIGKTLSSQQAVWQSHREAQCGLYTALFDNTAMYINSRVCDLRMGLQRAHELEQLTAFQPGQAMPCERLIDKPPTP